MVPTNSNPASDDDDYDIDFYTADPITHDNIDSATPSPREQLEASLYPFQNILILILF